MQRELALIGNVVRELITHPASEIAACTSLPDSIRLAMSRAGWSQETLAGKVNVSESYLSLILSADRKCPARLVLDIVVATKSAAPLQWMNSQVGLQVHLDPVEIRKADLRRELAQLEAA